MKKTLTLMALLACVGTGPLFATEHWWNGVSINKETNLLEGGYTSYKRSPSIDWNMCWAASAANAIAWWQDRVEENGALIIPEETPRGYDVWENVRLWWQNKGGFPGTAIQHWMTGWEGLYSVESYAQTALESSGIQHGGYYNRLAGANLSSSDYGSSFGANHERYEASPNTDYLYKYQYTMIQTYRFLSSNAESPDKTLYQSASERIIQYMDDDYAVLFSTPSHAMTVYGVNANEEGLIDKFYISDNNDIGAAKGMYRELSIFPSDESSANGPGLMDSNYWGNSHTIRDICVLRTNGIRFLDYDVRIGDNLVEEDEAVFSHYCNLIVDGKENFDLKYDLRDASVDGSPVDAKKVEQYTEDEGLSWSERYYGEEVSTGDMRLRGGKVTLVNCAEGREKLDGGGSVEGSIIFEDSRVKGTETIQEANRTLKVDRTDTIAKEIKLDATLGTNTLEVTDDHIASFGKLTGKGNLTKTGSGTAEVTEALDLDGHVTVQNGYFLLGESATFSGNTTLTVASDGHVSAKGSESSITLTLNSGVHLNDGEMTLTTTVNTGATLKGSGKFGAVTIDGGRLVVGNSPGHQEYTDTLTLTSGSLVFCVSAFDEASSRDNVGWTSGTYSTIEMNGNDLVIGEDGQILIALGSGAMDSLTMGSGNIEMILASNVTMADDSLSGLVGQTSFVLSDEPEALAARASLSPQNYLSNVSYALNNGNLVLRATYGTGDNVPEPATGSLSLLALAGLMARRRRK